MTEDRARQGRVEEVAQERRRRTEGSLGVSYKLAIPSDIEARLAAEGRTTRWANDEGSNIHDLTVNDDYDKVEGVEPVQVLVDRKNGTFVACHLLSKRTDFIAQDRAKAEDRRRYNETAAQKGHIPSATGAPTPLQGQMGAQTYVDPATSIGRGNQIIE